jgi:outer membrane receptor for ferrienterochelin and colicin
LLPHDAVEQNCAIYQKIYLDCLLALGGCLRARQSTRRAPVCPQSQQTVVVLGSPVPVPLAESPASVLVLPVEAKSLSLESPQDLLRQDSSITLEQRGAGGGQADVVLRGGTFEQTLVLLNGFRIDDSQTAHHNLDLPVALDAMDSIQVLHGAGSTLHGEDALSGVVDFRHRRALGNLAPPARRRRQLWRERRVSTGRPDAQALERALDCEPQLLDRLYGGSKLQRNLQLAATIS